MERRRSRGGCNMTEQTDSRIPYDDLKRISLECKTCGTEVTFDISREPLLQAEWDTKGLRCSFCTTPFDSQIKYAIDRYIQWFSRVKESGQPVFFLVKKT